MAQQVQICHSKMLVTRKGLPGHLVYGRVRNATELLEHPQLLNDKSRLTYNMAKIIELIDVAQRTDLQRVKMLQTVMEYSQERKADLEKRKIARKKKEAEEQAAEEKNF